MPARHSTTTYREQGRVYHADSCDALVDATTRGMLRMAAVARGAYPGTPLRRGSLAGLMSAGFWDAVQEQDWGLPWHRNEGIEITFLETGSMRFALDGSGHDLAPGDLTITRPWQRHRLGDPAIGIGRLHWIILDVGVRQPHQKWRWPDWIVITRRDRDQLTKYLRQNEHPVWKATPEIKQCFQNLADTVEADRGGSACSRLAIGINEIFLLLLESFRDKQIRLTASLTTAHRTTKMFLASLREHIDEPWTLESMAAHCGLGVTRFVHYCREITNQTPVNYLNQLRVAEAGRLMKRNPRRKIIDVALDCGFSSGQYFATVFKKFTGVPPQEYRNNCG